MKSVSFFIVLICFTLISCSRKETEKQVVEQIKLICTGNLFQSHSTLPNDGKTFDETKKGHKTYIFTSKKINDLIQWNLEEEGFIENLNLNYESLNEPGHPKKISSTFINDNEISVSLDFKKESSKNENMSSSNHRVIKINRINGDWYDNKVNEVDFNNGRISRDYYLNTGTCERVKENNI